MQAVLEQAEPPISDTTSSPRPLLDRFGREVNYLRISVTDRCDLRCVYCMAEDMQFAPRSHLLSLEEIVRIGTSFVELGVKKIRISGGEPLTRNNVLYVFEQFGALPGLEDLAITTNGTQLVHYAMALRAAGVTRVNISLDSLRMDRFRQITRNGELHKVLAGIDAALAAGFRKVKLNVVVMKHKNHDEVVELVQFARERGVDISFIEEMPLGEMANHDRACGYYSSDEVLRDLRRHYDLQATTESSGGPSSYFRMPDSAIRVGFISPHSHNFCATCNRVRLTAEGRLLLCLGQEHSADLRRIVRDRPADAAGLQRAIIDAMAIKPQGHDFDLRSQPVIFRHMSVTGG